MTQKIELGTVLHIRALRWDDGWEFDCPVVILDPVIRVYEDGRSLDQAIEDLLIDACIDGKISDHETWRWKDAPGGARGYLRRKFYRKYVQRAVVDVRFIHDEYGELSWEELPKPDKQPDLRVGAPEVSR